MPDTYPVQSLWPRYWAARVCDVYPIAAMMQPESDDTVLIPWWESGDTPTPFKGNHMKTDKDGGG